MKSETKELTKLAGIYASPVAHSFSPLMHNYSFEAYGIHAKYLAFEVGKEQLPGAIEAIRSLNMLGVNLSMPNKQLACKLVDELTPEAESIGAINTIVNQSGHLIGHNTDGKGFMSNIAEKGVNILGGKMVMLGTGGAATAIIVQAAFDGVAEIAIFCRKNNDFENKKLKFQKLAEKTKANIKLFDLIEIQRLQKEISEADLLVNATSVGMAPSIDKSPLPSSIVLAKDLIVADIVYNPLETKLLHQAKIQGCQTIDGMGMLLYQGAEAFRLWTGHDMPVEEVKSKLNI